MTLCQTFSDFLATANLIGSCDTPAVKGDAGLEEEGRNYWLGISWLKQDFGMICAYRSSSVIYRLCVRAA